MKIQKGQLLQKNLHKDLQEDPRSLPSYLNKLKKLMLKILKEN
jgi:hypothetical protein